MFPHNAKPGGSFHRVLKQGYKDSNLEMTESESVALPFGDSPSYSTNVIIFYIKEKSKHFF